MIKYTILALAPLSLLGCPTKSNCDSSDTAACDTSGEGEGEGEGTADFDASAALSSNGVTITLTNGSGSYDLGMEEVDPNSNDNWTGENCVDGYTTGDGTVYLYCHTLASAGGGYSLGALSDLETDAGGTQGTLTTYTLFKATKLVSYAVWNSNMDCYTWGEDTAFYVGEGCSDLGHT